MFCGCCFNTNFSLHTKKDLSTVTVALEPVLGAIACLLYFVSVDVFYETSFTTSVSKLKCFVRSYRLCRCYLIWDRWVLHYKRPGKQWRLWYSKFHTYHFLFWQRQKPRCNSWMVRQCEDILTTTWQIPSISLFVEDHHNAETTIVRDSTSAGRLVKEGVWQSAASQYSRRNKKSGAGNASVSREQKDKRKIIFCWQNTRDHLNDLILKFRLKNETSKTLQK